MVAIDWAGIIILLRDNATYSLTVDAFKVLYVTADGSSRILATTSGYQDIHYYCWARFCEGVSETCTYVYIYVPRTEPELSLAVEFDFPRKLDTHSGTTDGYRRLRHCGVQYFFMFFSVYILSLSYLQELLESISIETPRHHERFSKYSPHSLAHLRRNCWRRGSLRNISF